ncbi:hypothetical protein BKA65DRAFT_394565, partial [Rhexocercosporidium sp. MPI-PUGE-AT-0058]
FFDDYKHFYSVQKLVYKILYYTLRQLISFKDILLYFFFLGFYRKSQQNNRLLNNDFQT